MNNDKILSLLGLCRRAGRLTMGNDPAVDSILGGKSRLVIIAEDISVHTEKSVRSACTAAGVKCIKLKRSKDEISAAVGKYSAVLSVDDGGFAKKLKELIQTETESEE